jgi:hypothetical protein
MRIATGEIADDLPSAQGRKGGIKGGAARAQSLSNDERVEIAKKAAKVRWAARVK